MRHYHLTVQKNYFPGNTVANLRTKLSTPIEIDHEICEVVLAEISYPKG
jgi:hypothetical protein